MRILTFIANGTEDSELVTTLDLLKRAGIDYYLVSLDEIEVTLSHGIRIKADSLLKDLSIKSMLNYDGIFLPGGSRGTNTFKNSEQLAQILIEYDLRAKPIMAICAAPTVLGKVGILEGKKYTCYDGCEEEIEGGRYMKNIGAIRDQNIITAKSVYYTINFALKIIEYLKGNESVELVEKQILRRERRWKRIFISPLQFITHQEDFI